MELVAPWALSKDIARLLPYTCTSHRWIKFITPLAKAIKASSGGGQGSKFPYIVSLAMQQTGAPFTWDPSQASLHVDAWAPFAWV